MSTVSVVVPSLNDADMLRECLRHLAAQTRAPDEIIVVDNGSTDDTVAVAVAAGARVVSEPRRGVLRATAAGFDAATGDVIGRLDADSRPDPHWTARVAARFDADAELAGLTGTGEFYGAGRFWRWVGGHVYLGGYFWFIGIMAGQQPVFGSNFALRRTVWERIRDRVHLDDPHVHDDLEITMTLDADMRVEYDAELHVGVSARPFQNVAGFKRRASWAFHDIALNWGEIGWWERRRRRRWALRARRRSRSVVTNDGSGAERR
ncbi:glycosyltransferase family 2 protein [Microbacterium sp. KR10-403]|uniref:glycosyltransferase family 2 protein n=1 Tax=Microbacterium sp. KR10-403 TaxID=3158581 RepID=UPI0032E388D6